MIDEGQFGSPILLTVFNYAEGIQKGLELGTAYKTGGLSLYGNVASGFDRGKDIDTAQFNFSAADLAYISHNAIALDHQQTYTASGGAAYKWQETTGSLDFIYGSGLRSDKILPDGGDIPNGASLPPYTQVNFSLKQAIEVKSGMLEARFDIINLFDEPYELRNGTGIGVGAPQWGPRRAFYAGLDYRF